MGRVQDETPTTGTHSTVRWYHPPSGSQRGAVGRKRQRMDLIRMPEDDDFFSFQNIPQYDGAIPPSGRQEGTVESRKRPHGGDWKRIPPSHMPFEGGDPFSRRHVPQYNCVIPRPRPRS